MTSATKPIVINLSDAFCALVIEGNGIKVEFNGGDIIVHSGAVRYASNARLADQASSAALKVGDKVREGPNSGLIYGGLASDRQHHLLVEREDARDDKDERLILTFEEAVAQARSKDMEVPGRDDLNLLHRRADAIGGFDRSHNGWYWSASEVNDVIAWIQRFSDGCQDFHIKQDCNYLRRVRRCLVI